MEYALAVSLIVVASLGVIEALEDDTSDEVANQADCISTRPPPPSCQPAALVPLDGSGGGAGGDPGGGIVTPSQSASFDPPTGTGEASRGSGPVFAVTIDLDLRDASNQPIANQPINAQVVYSGAGPTRTGQFFYVSCTTDDAGSCTMAFDSGFPDVTQLSFDVVAVGVDVIYDVGDFPTMVIDQPDPNTTVPLP